MNGDCATYSMAAEYLKIAFRRSYPLFDKIACFVNAHWSIGLPERAVNFRRLSFDVDDGKAKSSLNVRARFDASRNGRSAVRSRYPEICLRRIFKSLRNPMRRSLPTSVTILNTSISNLSRCLCPTMDGGLYADHLTHIAELKEFEAMTFRIVWLARSALIHLGRAMLIEERHQAKDGDRYFPIETTLIPDELKW
ncbi:LA2681 family HEPN domain-containing protein [Paraburkholderia sabiae]|uniref:LA2681 family HEPN domain-containing protein n=1 Tax=Paraburkholderia sabiae TaxID=273251 RepID=A0ABU9QHH7_9BURK|nr:MULTISPECIES: LA2681 family HEPN domain-containing protein [Burkholderiaceae]MDR5877818.1 LA2681 family HEPN domain-containing protein [Caballeronia sp. LZ032]WJZ75526.1 LA2681 family HEPN domain-containing protein [Paraburkholderia sabiae]CAD6557193.1 hypothetical protein LMG24235_06058 [Paraburkholderia sabiae]